MNTNKLTKAIIAAIEKWDDRHFLTYHCPDGTIRDVVVKQVGRDNLEMVVFTHLVENE